MCATINQRFPQPAMVPMTLRLYLILLFTFCLPLPALAVLTFGAAPQKGAMIHSERQAVQLAAALQAQLGEEIRVRIFADEATLHTWLNRYQQVDIAAFSRSYVQRQPAGEFFQLHGTAAFGSRDPLVLRQGVSQRLLQRVQTAVSALAADPAARAIFQKPAVVAKAQPAPAPRKPAVKPPAPAPAPSAPTGADQTATSLPAPLPESPPVSADQQPKAPPAQAVSGSDAPRIWLGQSKDAPPAEGGETTAAAEQPALPGADQTPLAAGDEQRNRYSRENGIPGEPAPSASVDKTTLIGGIAVSIIAVAGSFLYLRRKRRSAIRTLTFAPRVALDASPTIISAARIKKQDSGPKRTETFQSAAEETSKSIDAPAPAANAPWNREDIEPQSPAAPEEPLEFAAAEGELTEPAAIIETTGTEEPSSTDVIEPVHLDTAESPFSEEIFEAAPEEPLELATVEEESTDPAAIIEAAGADEPWSTGKIEPVHLDTTENPFTEENIEAAAEEALELATAEAESTEPATAVEAAGADEPWSTGEIEPERLDADTPFAEESVESTPEEALELATAGEESTEPATAIEAAGAEEPWSTGEIEPARLDYTDNPIAGESIETAAEEPPELAATTEGSTEPATAIGGAGADEPWSTGEIELDRFDAAENPFGKDVQIYSPVHPPVESTEDVDTEGDAVDTVNFDDSDDGSSAPLEDPFQTTADDDSDTGPEDVSAIEFSDDAAAAGNRQELPFYSFDDSESDPFSSADKDAVPLAPTPDYRSYFNTETAAEPDEAAMPAVAPAPRPDEGSGRSSAGRSVSLRMKGELGPSQVPALLKLISGQKKAGTLVVQTRLDEKRIYFRKGKIAAVSAVNRARKAEAGFLMNKLGYLLIRQGIISEQSRDHALEICSRQPSRRIGEVLVEICNLSYEELKNTLRIQAEEIIFSLILFPHGSFEYFTEKSPIPADEDLAIDINELLKEASRQAAEWRELRKVIPSLDTVMEFKDNSRKKLNNARMTSHQELILSLINGKRTVHEICNKASMLELEVYKFLFLMAKARVISPVQTDALENA